MLLLKKKNKRSRLIGDPPKRREKVKEDVKEEVIEENKKEIEK